jgi:sugar O-acyltransferase (sialic acid O-acetyltransferase NeuD family)
MTKDIAIIGAGGFGREIKQLIDEINLSNQTWNLVGFYDSHTKQGTRINGVEVLGGDEEAINSSCQNFVLAIGNPNLIKNLSSRFLSVNKKLPNLVHPLASLGLFQCNEIGFGNIFTYGFHMTTNITIGNLNIFNTRVTLGHDVKVGSFNVFLPNVQISGNVSIGDENLFGMNSSVLEKKKIGFRNKIGAHSLVATNIGSEQSVFGNPAVKI